MEALLIVFITLAPIGVIAGIINLIMRQKEEEEDGGSGNEETGGTDRRRD